MKPCLEIVGGNEEIHFPTNHEVMDYISKQTPYMPPDRDSDERYKKMYTYIDKEGLRICLQDIDCSDTEQFISPSDPMHECLQPRIASFEERKSEIDSLKNQLAAGVQLRRIPIIAEIPGTKKLGKLAGYKRIEVLRTLGKSHLCIKVVGATKRQLRKLARLGNIPTQDDVEPLSESDVIHQYTSEAKGWMEDKGINIIAKGSDEATDLQEYLKKLICDENHKYCNDASRLGVVINKILDKVYDENDKRYLQPINLSLNDPEARDEYINEEWAKFYPHSEWNTSKNNDVGRKVYNQVRTAETFANAKQTLDTLLEKNDLLYSGLQVLYVADCIKYAKQPGGVLRQTVDSEIESRLKEWTELNTNKRRTKDYGIKPVERLFFPATFVGTDSRMFEWDKETETFIEKFLV